MTCSWKRGTKLDASNLINTRDAKQEFESIGNKAHKCSQITETRIDENKDDSV